MPRIKRGFQDDYDILLRAVRSLRMVCKDKESADYLPFFVSRILKVVRKYNKAVRAKTFMSLCFDDKGC